MVKKPIELEPFCFEPREDDLLIRAIAQPEQLEHLLRPILYDETLPEQLADLLRDFTDRCGTPEIPNWPRDPGRPSNYYRVCLILATLLGRAFSMLGLHSTNDAGASEALARASHLPPELRLQAHEAYVRNLAQRQRMWKAVADVFARGLLSHNIEPEPGARYASGILVLTCGKAISQWHALNGKGKEWVPWMGHYGNAEGRWSWADVLREVSATQTLPRQNTNGTECFQRVVQTYEEHRNYREDESSYWHISQEVLDVFDAARVHLAEAKDDLTSGQVMQRFLGGLDETNNETFPDIEISTLSRHRH